MTSRTCISRGMTCRKVLIQTHPWMADGRESCFPENTQATSLNWLLLFSFLHDLATTRAFSFSLLFHSWASCCAWANWKTCGEQLVQVWMTKMRIQTLLQASQAYNTENAGANADVNNQSQKTRGRFLHRYLPTWSKYGQNKIPDNSKSCGRKTPVSHVLSCLHNWKIT